MFSGTELLTLSCGRTRGGLGVDSTGISFGMVW